MWFLIKPSIRRQKLRSALLNRNRGLVTKAREMATKENQQKKKGRLAFLCCEAFSDCGPSSYNVVNTQNHFHFLLRPKKRRKIVYTNNPLAIQCRWYTEKKKIYIWSINTYLSIFSTFSTFFSVKQGLGKQSWSQSFVKSFRFSNLCFALKSFRIENQVS